jgi:hypothetical protein
MLRIELIPLRYLEAEQREVSHEHNVCHWEEDKKVGEEVSILSCENNVEEREVNLKEVSYLSVYNSDGEGERKA